ncbi:MFS transporter [Sciscionella marina]|uniref:MFS transporter n=1 Tax=Sciscionella marina TaxID=508770 RepID=UPI0003626E2A|nr:MFS transporter [Sciscionella marina]
MPNSADALRSASTPTATPTTRLWIAVLAGYLALGATLQTLPGYVVTRFHSGTVLAGLAVGIAFAATAATRPFAGRAADSGWARPVVLLGGVLTALGGFGHLLAPDIGWLLLARVLMGAGEAALFSAAIPWVLAGVPVARRGRIAGWFGLSMWGGLAGGPVLATVLARAGGPPGVWWLVAVLGAASAVLVLSTRARRGARGSILPSRLRDLLPRGAALPGLAFGLSAYGYGAISALLVLYLGARGIGGQDLALTVFAVCFLLARALGSPMVDRFGGAALAPVVLLAEVFGLGLLAAPGSVLTALLGAGLSGAGVALMFPATVHTTLARSGPLSPGTSVGVMTAFWDLGLLVAAPGSGILAQLLGFRAAFGFAALVVLGGICVALACRSRTRTRESARRSVGVS